MASKKKGLDDASLDDLLSWTNRVQGGEPEPEPEVLPGSPPQMMTYTPAGAVGGAAGGGALGQPPAGVGGTPASMHAASLLTPKPKPAPGTVDSLGRPLSAIEQGIISAPTTGAAAAPEKVELPVAIGKSWWTQDGTTPKCEFPGCTQVFGGRVRRHHCRKCGKCVCKDCSTYKLLLQHPEEKSRNKQVSYDRVCGGCWLEFKEFSNVTMGQGGVHFGETGGGGGGAAQGSPAGQGAGVGAGVENLGPRTSGINWSDVADEEDPQVASRMLRSGHAY